MGDIAARRHARLVPLGAGAAACAYSCLLQRKPLGYDVMDSDHRSACLRELGLVDWRPRADGPLGQSHSQPAAAETATATAPVVDVAPVVAEDVAAEGQPVSGSRATGSPAAAASATPDGMGWDELEDWLATRDHRGAQRPVFGVGARDADVLIVGEAPGAQEDAQGVPFVGRAGQLLDRMLFAIGCSRETNVYITNICKFRPPNNRDPNAEEVAADWPVLERQIELMDPTLVVAVGRVAAQTLLDSSDNLGKLRGCIHKYPQRDLDVLITYHPAFLLRSPQMKARAWVDLRQIAARIGAGGRTS